MNDSIHLNQSYIEFEFQFELSFPIILAVIPVVYVVPTVFVILRILSVFLGSLIRKGSVDMDRHIFLVIVASHWMNLLFFVSDYLMYRLPATGLFTSSCARSSPSHLLSLVVFFSFYSAYTIRIFPFLLSFIRLLLIVAPHSRSTPSILKLGVPFIFIYPLFFTFFLIPAFGICKQLGPPYPFGSVMVYYYGSLGGIHNSPVSLFNIVVWMFLCLLINAVLLLKLTEFNKRSPSYSKPSSRSKNAEFSITLTTISLLLAGLLNCIFALSYLTMPVYINYLTIVKPIGSDTELVVSPWIFYKTHPVFKKKTSGSMAVVSTL